MSSHCGISNKSRFKVTCLPPKAGRHWRRRGSVARLRSMLWAVVAAALTVGSGSSAQAANEDLNFLAGLLGRNKPVICHDQTYGLCAGASCFVFNDVAYCTCNVLKGNSVSSPFNFPGGDVCTVNAVGPSNGFMVSTFSPPKSLVDPRGDKAVYMCPRTSRANYAKCDGGICFTSTIKDGPRAGEKKIVCSCPVERANPIQGLEIIGPYPCQPAFFKNCDPEVANDNTGTTLYDGTAIGGTEIGTRLLDGGTTNLNTCR